MSHSIPPEEGKQANWAGAAPATAKEHQSEDEQPSAYERAKGWLVRKLTPAAEPQPHTKVLPTSPDFAERLLIQRERLEQSRQGEVASGLSGAAAVVGLPVAFTAGVEAAGAARESTAAKRAARSAVAMQAAQESDLSRLSEATEARKVQAARVKSTIGTLESFARDPQTTEAQRAWAHKKLAEAKLDPSTISGPRSEIQIEQSALAEMRAGEKAAALPGTAKRALRQAEAIEAEKGIPFAARLATAETRKAETAIEAANAKDMAREWAAARRAWTEPEKSARLMKSARAVLPAAAGATVPVIRPQAAAEIGIAANVERAAAKLSEEASFDAKVRKVQARIAKIVASDAEQAVMAAAGAQRTAAVAAKATSAASVARFVSDSVAFTLKAAKVLPPIASTAEFGALVWDQMEKTGDEGVVTWLATNHYERPLESNDVSDYTKHLLLKNKAMQERLYEAGVIGPSLYDEVERNRAKIGDIAAWRAAGAEDMPEQRTESGRRIMEEIEIAPWRQEPRGLPYEPIEISAPGSRRK